MAFELEYLSLGPLQPLALQVTSGSNNFTTLLHKKNYIPSTQEYTIKEHKLLKWEDRSSRIISNKSGIFAPTTKL